MAAPLRQQCHTHFRDDGSTHVRFLDASSPSATWLPSSGPQKPSVEPLPKKPRLEEKQDAAIDDPRLQELRREHERELCKLAELVPLKMKKKKKRRRKMNYEQLSKEDAAIDDANQAPVGEHRLRAVARHLGTQRRKQQQQKIEASEQRFRRQLEAWKREDEEFCRRKREALAAAPSAAAAAAAASSPAAPSDEADAPVAPPPPTPPSPDAACGDGADAAAAALAGTLAAWASSPAAPSDEADAPVAPPPPTPPSPDAACGDGADAAAAALAGTLAAWASSPAAPVDEVDALVAPPPPTPRPSLVQAGADGADAAAAALADGAPPASSPAAPADDADADKVSLTDLDAPTATSEVPSPSQFTSPVAPAEAAPGVLAQASVLAAAAAGPSFLAEGATPRRRRASAACATPSSSAPRALGAFELDDDDDEGDDDGGAPAPSPPAAGAETQLAADATPAPPAPRVDPRTTLPRTSLPNVPPATPSTPLSFDIAADDPFLLAAADAASPFGILRPLGTQPPVTACPLEGDQCGGTCCRTPPPPPSPSEKSDTSDRDSDDNSDAEQVKCCMCGRDDDGEWLLCDGRDADGNPCPNEAHTSCVASVPDATDPWYCPACSSQVFVVEDAPDDLGHDQIVVSEACMRLFRLEVYEVVMVKGPTGIGWGEYVVIRGAGSDTHAVGLTAALRKELGVEVGGLVVVAPSGLGRDLTTDLAAVEMQELPTPGGFKPLRAFKKPDAADAEDPDADEEEESESEESSFGDESDAHEDAPESEDDDDVVGGGSDDEDDDDDDQGDNGGDEPSAKNAPASAPAAASTLPPSHRWSRYTDGQEVRLHDGSTAIVRATCRSGHVDVQIIRDEHGQPASTSAVYKNSARTGLSRPVTPGCVRIKGKEIVGHVMQMEARSKAAGKTREEYDADAAKRKELRDAGPPPPIKGSPKARDLGQDTPDVISPFIRRLYMAAHSSDVRCCYFDDDDLLVVLDRDAFAKHLGYKASSSSTDLRNRVPLSHLGFKWVGGGGQGCSWTAYRHEHFRADGADLHRVHRRDEGARCFKYDNLRSHCPHGCHDKDATRTYKQCGGGRCPTSGKLRANCHLGCEPSDGKPPCGNGFVRRLLKRLLEQSQQGGHTSEQIDELFGYNSRDLHKVLIAASPYGEDTIQLWNDGLLEVDHIISLKYLRRVLGNFIRLNGDEKEPTLAALLANCLINLQLLLKELNRRKSATVTDKTLRGIERRYEVLMRAVELTDPSGDGRWIYPHPLKKQKKEEEKVYVNIDILCQLLKEDVAANGGEIGCEDIQRC